MTDYIPVIIDSLSGFGTMGALIWGIVVYKEEQSNKRKELAFKLLTDIENNDKIRLAMAILKGFIVRVPNDNLKYQRSYYHINNLKIILRDHMKDPIVDPGELEIRLSFDVLLSFFDKLALQLNMGAIKRKEIEYFRDYIEELKINEAVNEYAKTYNYVNYFKILSIYK